jgi:hypothetical protein
MRNLTFQEQMEIAHKRMMDAWRAEVQSGVYPNYPFSEIKKETNMNDEIDDSLLEQEEQELLADQLHEERVEKFKLEQPLIYRLINELNNLVPYKFEASIDELAQDLLDHYVPEEKTEFYVEKVDREAGKITIGSRPQEVSITLPAGMRIKTTGRQLGIPRLEYNTCTCDMQLLMSSGCKCGGT